MVFESFVELYKSSVSTQYHLNQGHITEKIVWITTKHFTLDCSAYCLFLCWGGSPTVSYVVVKLKFRFTVIIFILVYDHYAYANAPLLNYRSLVNSSIRI